MKLYEIVQYLQRGLIVNQIYIYNQLNISS